MTSARESDSASHRLQDLNQVQFITSWTAESVRVCDGESNKDVTAGLKLSFDARDYFVDVLLCFECDVVSVGHDDQFISGSNFHYGQSLAGQQHFRGVLSL